MNIKEIGKLKLFKKLLDNKNYDEIYTLFGRDLYALFTPFSYKKEDIKKLMNEQNYSTIYNKYGYIETLFIKNFRKRKKEEIEKLLDEKRYIELYEKYPSEVNTNQKEIVNNDIEYEAPTNKVKLYKAEKSLARGLKNCLYILESLSIGAIVILSDFRYTINSQYEQDLIDNAILIQKYDDKIESYADEIHSLNLDNDLDIIMKVMYDMWNEMEGYGTPKLDINNLGRLDFTDANGVGVCRNIADDFSARMNAINPKYNARNITVYLNDEAYTHESFDNIKTKRAKETTNNNVDNEEEDSIDITKYFGNHMVSILNPIDKDYTLVVDPTNPSIGIINDGEIYIFSTETGNGLTFKPLGQILTNINSDEIVYTFISSTFNDLDKQKLDALSYEWGVDAQNEALEKIKSKTR